MLIPPPPVEPNNNVSHIPPRLSLDYFGNTNIITLIKTGILYLDIFSVHRQSHATTNPFPAEVAVSHIGLSCFPHAGCHHSVKKNQMLSTQGENTYWWGPNSNHEMVYIDFIISGLGSAKGMYRHWGRHIGSVD